MQYEENEFLSHSSHSGSEIAEWNIYGLAEHQIYSELHEMDMAITAYKKKLSDKQAATLFIVGFTGTLKNWWDNYLTEDNRKMVPKATTTIPTIKTKSRGQTIENQILEDATASLIYSIAKRFIGEPQFFQDRSFKILSNLSCPKLDNFRGYKVVFINKVIICKDCNHDYWKEKLINGLSILFAEKVRIKLKDRFGGKNSYNQLTYGDLISFLNITGLELCTDMKIKN